LLRQFLRLALCHHHHTAPHLVVAVAFIAIGCFSVFFLGRIGRMMEKKGRINCGSFGEKERRIAKGCRQNREDREYREDNSYPTRERLFISFHLPHPSRAYARVGNMLPMLPILPKFSTSL
jgi:hypothetical protein